MKKCWYCGENDLFGDNCSREHIIPDALGGRLRSEGLLCLTCNSVLGGTVDNVLCEALRLYTHIINPIRDRPKDVVLSAYDESGNPFVIRTGNKDQSVLTMTIDDKLIRPRSFNTDFEMRAFISKKMTELSKSGRKGQVEIFKPDKPTSEVYSTVEKKVMVSELTILKPLAKIALNYYAYCTGDSYYIREMVEILKRTNRGILDTHGRFFYSPIPVYEETENEVSHNLLLIGDPKERTLVAFVEVLSLYSALFVLNLNYDGEYVEKSYSYDVVTGQEIDRELTLYPRNRNFYAHLRNQPKRQNNFLMQQRFHRLTEVLNREKNQEIFRSR